MCADSFITSPSWPVRVRPGSPVHRGGLDEQHVAAGAGDREAGGHARGRRALGRLRREPGPAEVVGQVVDVDADRRRSTSPASTATLRRILASARSSCRTPASRVCSAAIAPSASSSMDTSSAVRPARSSWRGQQVVAGDGDLLLLGVAVERDQLHPVQQRAGDGLDHVGGGQEQHVGQVEVDLQVVVAERVVLRRVEHLEQGRGRVAGVADGQLVDLVEQHDRVHRTGLAQRPDDAAGQRADVGAPVAADLGLVADAAERRPGRTCGRAPARRTRRGWSCRRREGRPRASTAPEPRPPTTCRLRAARRLRTARYSRMRSFTSARPAWSASSTARAAARSVLSSVRVVHGISSTVSSQVRIQPASGEASLARSSLPTSRMRRLAYLLGQLGGLDPGPVVGRAVGLVLAQLLADRGELLAQQELALATSPGPRGRRC